MVIYLFGIKFNSWLELIICLIFILIVFLLPKSWIPDLKNPYRQMTAKEFVVALVSILGALILLMVFVITYQKQFFQFINNFSQTFQGLL